MAIKIELMKITDTAGKVVNKYGKIGRMKKYFCAADIIYVAQNMRKNR